MVLSQTAQAQSNELNNSSATSYLSQIANYVSSINQLLKSSGVTRDLLIEPLPLESSSSVLTSPAQDLLDEATRLKYLSLPPERVCPYPLQSEMYAQCASQLYLHVATVAKIDRSLTLIEARAQQIKKINEREPSSLADVQTRQLRVQTAQLAIQNEALHLETLLKAFEHRQRWYQQQIEQAIVQKIKGNGVAVDFPKIR